MPAHRLDLSHVGLVHGLGNAVRTSRDLVGWSQRELAARAGTSQAAIWRLETAQPGSVDLAVVERVLGALGMRAALEIDDRHLDDRRRQRDGVHARLNGYVARRLVTLDWSVATEVAIGDDAPRGWIDLLAFRLADRSLLVEEAKTDMPDMGAMQRQVAFYARSAWDVARRLGWQPARLRVLVVGLDSGAMGARLRDNRDLVAHAFPEPVDRMAAWLADSALPSPGGWCFGLADPASRRRAWLREPPVGSRRRAPAYRDYADAAARLLQA